MCEAATKIPTNEIQRAQNINAIVTNDDKRRAPSTKQNESSPEKWKRKYDDNHTEQWMNKYIWTNDNNNRTHDSSTPLRCVFHCSKFDFCSWAFAFGYFSVEKSIFSICACDGTYSEQKETRKKDI